MGMTAANKAATVVSNVRRVLGIELICAAQALDLRGTLKPGTALRPVYDIVRERVPFAEKDRLFVDDLEAIDRIVDDVRDLDADPIAAVRSVLPDFG